MNTSELIEELNTRTFKELFRIREHIDKLVRYQLIGMNILDVE